MPERLRSSDLGGIVCADQAKEDKAVSRELWEERAGLMKELGWDHWENLATTSLVRSVQNPHPRALYESPLHVVSRPRLLAFVRTA